MKTPRDTLAPYLLASEAKFITVFTEQGTTRKVSKECDAHPRHTVTASWHGSIAIADGTMTRYAYVYQRAEGNNGNNNQDS